jgi:uncharacterized protein YbaA (DUF1428 family)
MAKYVDGFVLMVPKKNLEDYKKMATKAGKVWMKCGALDYKECVIEDPTPQDVKLTFQKMTKAKEDEVIFFSYIVYKSRSHRDKVNAQVMKDPLMNDPKYQEMPMPFDMKRMAYAGFQSIVDLS